MKTTPMICTHTTLWRRPASFTQCVREHSMLERCMGDFYRAEDRLDVKPFSAALRNE
ncbi:MAG: hypothetical protein ACTHK7_00680 [Aureliella sp.]